MHPAGIVSNNFANPEAFPLFTTTSMIDSVADLFVILRTHTIEEGSWFEGVGVVVSVLVATGVVAELAGVVAAVLFEAVVVSVGVVVVVGVTGVVSEVVVVTGVVAATTGSVVVVFVTTGCADVLPSILIVAGDISIDCFPLSAT